MKRLIISLWSILLCSYALAQSIEQNVEITSNDGIMLRGTLTLPSLDQESAITVAILVAGSGPTDRDGNNVILRNNSLRMLSDSLVNNGIATIRYDKRGIGESVGNVSTFVTIEDFAEDVASWCAMANEDNRLDSIVLIGHSEGGKLALMAIEDGAVADKLILIATPGRTTDIILKEQLESQPQQIKQEAFAIIEELKARRTVETIPAYLYALFRPTIQHFLISDFSVDPVELIDEIDIPTLIVQGSTDIQITTTDAVALKTANRNAQLAIINSMNHVLKECLTTNREVQLVTYSNPSISLHRKLVPTIVSFIKTN